MASAVSCTIISPKTMKPIRNLLFDYGGVLCDLNWDKMIAAFCELGCNSQAFSPDIIHDELFRRIDRGTIGEADFLVGLRKLLHLPNATDTQLVRAWNSLLGGIPEQRKAALRRLKDRYRLYLLSNVNEIHWRCCVDQFSDYRGESMWSWFAQVFVSYKMHLEKPEPEIYLTVARQAGIEPAETLFIDDHEENVEGARAVGFQVLQALGDAWIAPLDHLMQTDTLQIQS